MIDNSRATADPDSLLDNLAAELTRAAYHVALRHGAAATWLDLELDLWCALADAINRWRQGKSLPGQLPLGSAYPSR
ncbi:MAG TPA: hypothetical protein VG013_17300 [Gemmataceae bacterium]|nr:hypothetical protein [Gemmataceae bacterium]